MTAPAYRAFLLGARTRRDQRAEALRAALAHLRALEALLARVRGSQ